MGRRNHKIKGSNFVIIFWGAKGPAHMECRMVLIVSGKLILSQIFTQIFLYSLFTKVEKVVGLDGENIHKLCKLSFKDFPHILALT